MSELCHRSVELRDVQFSERIIELRACPYNSPVNLGPYIEVIAPGAFNRRRELVLRGDRIKLTIGHGATGRPVGRAVSWQDTETELVGRFRISRTRDGDEALEMAADGVLDASVEFEPIRDLWDADRTRVVRHTARLHRVALVPEPAYQEARVLAVRGDADQSRLAQALALIERMRG